MDPGPEAGHAQPVTGLAGAARQPDRDGRGAVDGHDVERGPGQTAEHGPEEHHHRARAREDFGRHGRNPGRVDGSYEGPGRQWPTRQADAEWRELDGGTGLGCFPAEGGHIARRRDRTARPERHDGRRLGARRARRVRPQRMKSERRPCPSGRATPSSRRRSRTAGRPPGGSRARCRAVSEPGTALVAGAPIHARHRSPLVPLAGITTLRPGFTRVRGAS
ncbi:hypothetical protein EASAB2608_01290 [Streptomyces sp. EAS-AB2608]|nr:hypothetical protein EASAB2608_01290 [Streptomyces sp. EAS-AB2608]